MEMEVEYTGAEDYAFRRDVVRARVASDVTEIGDTAFEYCDNLREIDLGNTVRIGEKAFQYCWLRVIRMPPTLTAIFDGAFAYCAGLIEVDLGNVTMIGEGAFYRCEALRSIRLSPTLTEIRRQTFCECTNLRDVDLGNVTAIGGAAFEGCKALEGIRLPPTLTHVGCLAFKGCSKLKEVNLGAVTTIGSSAFQNCDLLESVTVPSAVSYIGDEAFSNCQLLRMVELCEGIHHIRRRPFQGCRSLHHITIPSKAFIVTSLSDTPICRFVTSSTTSSMEEQIVVSDKSFASMGPCLSKLQSKINDIIGRNDESTAKTIGHIRQSINYFELIEAMTLLELALWKSRIGEEEKLKENKSDDCSLSMRGHCRINCGASVIVPNVLSYLNRSEEEWAVEISSDYSLQSYRSSSSESDTDDDLIY